jgi:hypothetical protein
LRKLWRVLTTLVAVLVLAVGVSLRRTIARLSLGLLAAVSTVTSISAV